MSVSPRRNGRLPHRVKWSVAAVCVLAAALIVLLHTGGRNLFTGTLASTVPKQLAGTLQDVTVDNGEVVFEFGEQRIRVQVKQDQGMPALYIYDADTGQPIRMEMHEKTGRLRASDENWHLPKKSLTFEALIRGNGADRQAYVTAWYRNQVPWVFRVSDKGTLIYLNPAGKESIPCKDVYISYIGPIIGASIGADAIGVFSWGKNVERFKQS